MVFTRPKRLTYHGRQVPAVVDPDGTVLETRGDHFFPGIPARDLNEDDVAALSDDQLKTIMAARYGDGTLYSDADAKNADASAKKSSAPKAAKRTRASKSRASTAADAPGAVVEADATVDAKASIEANESEGGSAPAETTGVP